MTLSRRSFLTRSGLALGALVVGEEAIEAFARLTHVRKSFPSAGMPVTYTARMVAVQRARGVEALERVTAEFSRSFFYQNVRPVRDWRTTPRTTYLA